ncbi:MAG: flavin reductase family protein [Hyphomicrobiaceae bacterium]|nr:flavin reductase family protein [Hyphomicrobiaceae bacterium]
MTTAQGLPDGARRAHLPPHHDMQQPTGQPTAARPTTGQRRTLTFQATTGPLGETVDPAAYRALMRHHASAVTIIATGRRGARAGLTATAVASLSDTPPTVLVAVNRTAGAHDLIAGGAGFSVNVLAAGQDDIARRFAGRSGLKGEARFVGLDWDELATGAPILPGAVASIDCRLVASHGFPTHTVFIGEVVAGRADALSEPLIYFRGGYRRIAQER